MVLAGCSTPPPDPVAEPEFACTLIGPPFGVAFDLSALAGAPQPAGNPRVADYCADDVCQSVEVRLFGTAAEDVDPSALFVPVWDGPAPATAHLRLHDEGGAVTREVSAPLRARAVTSDVNGPRCLAEGHWAAVRVGPDGALTDVTASTPLPESLQER